MHVLELESRIAASNPFGIEVSVSKIDDGNIDFSTGYISIGGQFSSIGFATAVLDRMAAEKVTFKVGVGDMTGVHGFVAYRYKSSSNYGAIIIFDCFGTASFVYLNNGTYAAKPLGN